MLNLICLWLKVFLISFCRSHPLKIALRGFLAPIERNENVFSIHTKARLKGENAYFPATSAVHASRMRVCVCVSVCCIFFALFVCGVESFIYCVRFTFWLTVLFVVHYSRELYHHTPNLVIFRRAYEPSGELETRAARRVPAYTHTPEISHGGHLCDWV